MILIADGGSTKCDWLGYDLNSKEKCFSFQTSGLNPSYLSKNEITSELRKHRELYAIGNRVTELYFFGSGCGNPFYQKIMKDIFQYFFGQLERIVVLGDIEGAVFACTDQPAVVAILGTGSNICYFDGNIIETRIPSLGYTIMDQGSGNHMGRELIKAYYFNLLPMEVKFQMENQFELDVDLMKQNLYTRGVPSSYLASFAKFIFQNEDIPQLNQIITKTLNDFFDLSVNQFDKELTGIPLHFVGSIAHYTRNYIEKICDERGITLGKIVKRPIDSIYANLEAIQAHHS
jgi:N-acetylglucosamine kinase-like BadF-type ATPase